MKDYKTLNELQEDLRVGNLTCVQLVQQYLDRINLNSHLNAFVEVYSGESLLRALEIDRKIK